MKTLLTALASVSLLAAPLAAAPSLAQAQSRDHGGGPRGPGGGGGGGGGGQGAGPSRGGYGGGGGYGRAPGGHAPSGYSHGYGGYRGYRGYDYWGGVGFGLALASAYAYPFWYDDYPAYYGYYGYGYSSYYGPTVIDRYETVYEDRDDSASTPTYRDAPATVQAPQAACGSWSWDAANDRYNWVPC